MNNFASFSEDALPRSIPLPSVDPRSLNLKANAAIPSVPELSMLNYDAPVPQPPSVPKPTSYSAWKSEHINGRIGSQPVDCERDRPVQRKTVSFDTPLAKVDLPAFNGNAVHAVTINDQDRRPAVCGQLELSAFEPPRPQAQSHVPIVVQSNHNEQYSHNVPISQIQQMRQQIIDRVNNGCAAPAVHDTPEQVPNQLRASDIVNLRSQGLDSPTSNSSELLPIVVELIRMLGGKSNNEIQNMVKEHSPPPVLPAADKPVPVYVSSPPKDDSNENSEPTLQDLHQLVLKQQKEIKLLQEQVNHLMQIQENAQHPPEIINHHRTQMHQTQPSTMSPDHELALGEEASTFPNQHQTPQTHPQFHRRHHNSPADWKFYGNTLEQVAQILQNAPPSRSPASQAPNQQQVDKVIQVHMQGMHFSDVNVSATQRVTFAPTPNTANHFETPKQTHRPIRNGSLPALSDRSMAMNTLALKYLPEHQNNNGFHLTGQTENKTSPAAGIENTAPTRRSKSPEMSAMTLDYLHKYGLLGNKRLFDE